MTDDYTYFEHAIKDAMRGAKEDLPVEPKSPEELNHDEYVRQRIEEDNPGPGAGNIVERKRLTKAYKAHKPNLLKIYKK